MTIMSEEDAKILSKKCQCDRDSMYHRANFCPNEATYEVVTDKGVVMRVCGDCTSGGDKETRRL